MKVTITTLWVLRLFLFTDRATAQSVVSENKRNGASPADMDMRATPLVESVIDLLGGSSVFSQLLVQLMSFDTSLSHYLTKMGRYTLFAPSDEALQGLVQDGTVFRLLRPEYRMYLYSLVMFQFTAQEFPLKESKNSSIALETLKMMSGDKLGATMEGSWTYLFREGLAKPVGRIKHDEPIESEDTNIVAYASNTVLMPAWLTKGLMDYMDPFSAAARKSANLVTIRENSYSIFYSMLVAAGMDTNIWENKVNHDLTLLIVPDSAFESGSVTALMNPMNQDMLRDFVWYHILTEVLDIRSMPADSYGMYTTKQGEDIRVSADNKDKGGVYVNDAPVRGFQLTRDGVMYEIGSPLMPPSWKSAKISVEEDPSLVAFPADEQTFDMVQETAFDGRAKEAPSHVDEALSEQQQLDGEKNVDGDERAEEEPSRVGFPTDQQQFLEQIGDSILFGEQTKEEPSRAGLPTDQQETHDQVPAFYGDEQVVVNTLSRVELPSEQQQQLDAKKDVDGDEQAEGEPSRIGFPTDQQFLDQVGDSILLGEQTKEEPSRAELPTDQEKHEQVPAFYKDKQVVVEPLARVELRSEQPQQLEGKNDVDGDEQAEGGPSRAGFPTDQQFLGQIGDVSVFHKQTKEDEPSRVEVPTDQGKDVDGNEQTEGGPSLAGFPTDQQFLDQIGDVSVFNEQTKEEPSRVELPTDQEKHEQVPAFYNDEQVVVESLARVDELLSEQQQDGEQTEGDEPSRVELTAADQQGSNLVRQEGNDEQIPLGEQPSLVEFHQDEVDLSEESNIKDGVKGGPSRVGLPAGQRLKHGVRGSPDRVDLNP